MADFFSITVDQLLNIDHIMEQKKVEEYVSRFQAFVSRGDIEECIKVAREGVAEFPNNYTLLNQLMYALFIAGDEEGNIPNWKENRKKYEKEIDELGQRIIRYCTDQDIRLEATARLAFHYCETGRKSQGRDVYNTLPSQEYCRENQIWWALEQEERLPYIRKLIKAGYENLRDGMWTLISQKLLPDEQLAAVCEKLQELDKIVFNEPNIWDGYYDADTCSMMARVYARLGENEKALELLKTAADAAIEFDRRPQNEQVNSLLLGEIQYQNTEYDTTDSRSCCDILHDELMTHEDFAPLRANKTFQSVMKKLICDHV